MRFEDLRSGNGLFRVFGFSIAWQVFLGDLGSQTLVGVDIGYIPKD